MIQKAHMEGSSLSFWRVSGSLFVATCVGLLAANLVWYYTEGGIEISTSVGFIAAYLAKKILVWLDALEVSDLISYLRGKKK